MIPGEEEVRRPRWPTVLAITFLPVLLAYAVSYLFVVAFNLSNDAYLNDYEYIAMVFYVILFVVVAAAVRSEGRSLASVFNFARNRLAVDIGIGLLLVVAVIFVLDQFYVSVWTLYRPVPHLIYFGSQPPPAVFLLVIVPGVVAVTEELIWRGYSISRFQMLTNSPTKSVLLASLGFGVWHHNLYLSGLTFFTGILFGYVFVKTRRLAPTIAAHWIIDSLAFYALLLG